MQRSLTPFKFARTIASALAIGVLGILTGEESIVVLPAFPGAAESEMGKVGGRRGRLVEVSNLQDSGPGSLREALESGGPRMIVFKVSGCIRLGSPIVVNAPYATVAGQTAPGGPVRICGEGIEVDTREILLRDLVFEEECSGQRVLAVPPALDSDNDGMPDAWERRHGFNASSPGEGWKDADKDGYTNLEEYLNGTDPNVFVDNSSHL